MGEFFYIKYTPIELLKSGVRDDKEKMGTTVPQIGTQLPEAWENF